MKRQATNLKKIFGNHISGKGPVSKIYKELSKLNSLKKTIINDPLRKCIKHIKRHFTEEDIQMANKKTSCSTSLAFREIQTIRMAKIKNNDNIKCW